MRRLAASGGASAHPAHSPPKKFYHSFYKNAKSCIYAGVKIIIYRRAGVKTRTFPHINRVFHRKKAFDAEKSL
jgi:hypothetical protein